METVDRLTIEKEDLSFSLLSYASPMLFCFPSPRPDHLLLASCLGVVILLDLVWLLSIGVHDGHPAIRSGPEQYEPRCAPLFSYLV